MEIDYLILADAAQVVNGKLYLLGGGWDRLAAATLPTGHMLGVAVGVMVPWAEANSSRTLTLTIADEDGGTVLAPVTVRVEVGRPAGLPAGAEQRVVLAFNAPVSLPRLGDYAVTAVLDGGPEKRHRFSVVPGPGFQEGLRSGD